MNNISNIIDYIEYENLLKDEVYSDLYMNSDLDLLPKEYQLYKLYLHNAVHKDKFMPTAPTASIIFLIGCKEHIIYNDIDNLESKPELTLFFHVINFSNWEQCIMTKYLNKDNYGKYETNKLMFKLFYQDISTCSVNEQNKIYSFIKENNIYNKLLPVKNLSIFYSKAKNISVPF